MTNYERIKAMSIDEMALMFHNILKVRDEKYEKLLIDAGVSYSKIDLTDELQIEIHKQYLASEFV